MALPVAGEDSSSKACQDLGWEVILPPPGTKLQASENQWANLSDSSCFVPQASVMADCLLYAWP